MVKFFGKDKETVDVEPPEGEEVEVVPSQPDVRPAVRAQIAELLGQVRSEAVEVPIDNEGTTQTYINSDSGDALPVNEADMAEVEKDQQAWQTKDIPDQPA